MYDDPDVEGQRGAVIEICVQLGLCTFRPGVGLQLNLEQVVSLLLEVRDQRALDPGLQAQLVPVLCA